MVLLLEPNISLFNEYFDHLWALHDALLADGLAIVMGDLNGDLGNSLEDKAKHKPYQRGVKVRDFANDLNL